MSARNIQIRGARTHNLQDLDVDIPLGAWTVVCGVSGSGKSSLVMDTLGAESRRRFLGTFSRGLRGLDLVARPDVDRVDGLPPAVVAGFANRAPDARQTLGTVTEVTYALRALFMRAATPHCPTCGRPVAAASADRIVGELLAQPARTRVVLTAGYGTGPEAVSEAAREGFVRVRRGDDIVRIEDIDSDALPADERIAVVIDRLIVKPDARERFAASVDQALQLGDHRFTASIDPPDADAFVTHFADRPYCVPCDTSYPPLSTSVLSFQSAAGACATCAGRGLVPVLDPQRVLPIALRLRRIAGHLRTAIPPAERARLREHVQSLLATHELDDRDPVGALPAAVRRRWLEGSKRPKRSGLLAVIRAHGRWSRLASWETCGDCDGGRLSAYARAATLGGRSLPELCAQSAESARSWLKALELDGAAALLAEPALEDAEMRLRFLSDVGLDYLTLARRAGTLSSGELRRAQLVSACAARMSGLLYLLDEPTVGLHPADRGPLRDRLKTLVSEGNTVVSVDHDQEALQHAQHVIELGPGSGVDGGRFVAQGAPADIVGAPICDARLPALRDTRAHDEGDVDFENVRHRNVNLSCSFPRRGLTVVTGVSGAGKSTLAVDVIAHALAARVHGAAPVEPRAGAIHDGCGFERVIRAVGTPTRHARATAGSVLGVLAPLRDLYAATLDARAHGWNASRFSSNTRGGRCETCKGLGVQGAAVRDLPGLRVPCDVCEGTGFDRETLRIRVKGFSIHQALQLPLKEAASVFHDLPRVVGPLRAATDVGLGHLALGESTMRVSGGEALRLRLAAALGRASRARTLFVLDEPCAGLHPSDVRHLVAVLRRLVDDGHAVLAVEHHAHLICAADHVLELGPGPAERGGTLLFAGSPADLAKTTTPTGAWLHLVTTSARSG